MEKLCTLKILILDPQGLVYDSFINLWPLCSQNVPASEK